MMSREENRKLHRRSLLLIAALAGAIVLTLAAGTLAWLRYDRSLQTAAMIQVPTLSIRGSTDDAIPIDLGEIDVSGAGSKSVIFRVVSNPGTRYLVQLAHTTNIPLTYTIYPASTSGTGSSVTENGVTCYYSTALDGAYLNQNGTQHEATYGTYGNVQKNAEPLYWQSEVQTSDAGDDFYVLVVSWSGGLQNDKETDMIYLTAGIGGAA